MSAQRRTRLLLVGAGHAHLHLLRHGSALRAAGYDVILVAPGTFRYSGRAAAVASGALRPERSRIDVSALAASHGITHLDDTLGDLDVHQRLGVTHSGHRLEWDLASVNIGSATSGDGPENESTVVRVKPLADLERLRQLAQDPSGRIVIVGAGFSGIEIAAQLSANVPRSPRGSITLVHRGNRIGTELPERASRRVSELLAERGVDVLARTEVVSVGAGEVLLANGRTLSSDGTVLASGLAAAPEVARWGLGDLRGIPVDAGLRHREHPHLYASGDCAHFTPKPLPRVGVHGVRQGPVLLAALINRHRGLPAPAYRPAAHHLAILDLGGGRALAVRGQAWWEGRGSSVAKRWIDSRWLSRHSA